MQNLFSLRSIYIPYHNIRERSNMKAMLLLTVTCRSSQLNLRTADSLPASDSTHHISLASFISSEHNTIHPLRLPIPLNRIRSRCLTALLPYSTTPLRPNLHTLILPTRNIVQSSLEVFSRILQTSSIICSIQIRVYEFDKSIEVFRRHGVVFLIEVVDISIEDLDEEFNGYCSVHAGICDSEGSLETFEDAFAVAVGLVYTVSIS